MDSRRRLFPTLTHFAGACLLICAAAVTAQQQTAPQLLTPAEAFRLDAAREVPERVRLTWTIAAGYYLYRDRFRFESAVGAPPRMLVFPAGEPKNDPYFGPTEVYRGRVVIELGLDADGDADRPVSLRVISQGCADIGVCFPPQTARLTLATGDNIRVGPGGMAASGAPAHAAVDASTTRLFIGGAEDPVNGRIGVPAAGPGPLVARGRDTLR